MIVGTVKMKEVLSGFNEVCYTIRKLLFLQMKSGWFGEAVYKLLKQQHSTKSKEICVSKIIPLL